MRQALLWYAVHRAKWSTMWPALLWVHRQARPAVVQELAVRWTPVVEQMAVMRAAARQTATWRVRQAALQVAVALARVRVALAALLALGLLAMTAELTAALLALEKLAIPQSPSGKMSCQSPQVRASPMPHVPARAKGGEAQKHHLLPPCTRCRRLPNRWVRRQPNQRERNGHRPEPPPLSPSALQPAGARPDALHVVQPWSFPCAPCVPYRVAAGRDERRVARRPHCCEHPSFFGVWGGTRCGVARDVGWHNELTILHKMHIGEMWGGITS